jgi:hypothetical protein
MIRNWVEPSICKAASYFSDVICLFTVAHRLMFSLQICFFFLQWTCFQLQLSELMTYSLYIFVFYSLCSFFLWTVLLIGNMELTNL